MEREAPTTHQKAFRINLDPVRYGTFAEIGAGQEVARWFFHVGAAAGTVAKTMSAYDMTFSDAVYGPCERFVSRQRLQEMLDVEYRLLIERLDARRGASSNFFVFADTVAAKSYLRHDDANGWMGIRFQSGPRSPPSEIIIHVRMLDPENVQQQETLGIIGVNLIYGAFYLHDRPEELIASLMDNLSRDRIEVDLAKFSGPAFASVDNRLMSLQLVQQGLSDAAMFTASGEVVQPAEVLHKKPVLVERGNFRPITRLTMDMLECSEKKFRAELGPDAAEPVVLMEMTLKRLLSEGEIDHRDFLARADILGALGKSVLISNFFEYYRLVGCLSRSTDQAIRIAMGVPSLKEVLNEKYYDGLEGGILEAMGRLFKSQVRLYVYPLQEPGGGRLVTSRNLEVAPHLKYLYAHLLENGRLRDIEDFDGAVLHIFPQDVLAAIQKSDPKWETMVPAPAVERIKNGRFFGYGG